MLPQILRGRADGAMLIAIQFVVIFEAPARDTRIDHLPAVTGLDTGGGIDTAIVSAAGLGTIRVDGTTAIHEHVAMAVVAKAHEPAAIRYDVGLQVALADARQRLRFMRAHLDVVRRRAASHAIAAGHIHPGAARERSPHGTQPVRKAARRQRSVVAHAPTSTRKLP